MLKTLLSRITELYDGIKSGERKIPKDGMLILFLSGVLIYIILLPSKDSSFTSLTNRVTGDIRGEGYSEEVINDYKSRMENELEDFLHSIEGVGEVKVLMYVSEGDATSFYQKEDVKISGIIIGAQGAKSEAVKSQIIHLVMVLYGLDIDKVEVFPLKGNF